MLETIKALTTEYDMLPRGGTVLCAVSGGADSMCLLHLLHTWAGEGGFRVAAAHYNHNLRGAESDRDAVSYTHLDFYLRTNREIYETIYSMFNFSLTIDPVTVLEHMKQNGVYDENTSRNYVLQLMEITPTAANVKEYVAIVKDKALLRRIAETAGELTAMVQEGTGTAQEVLEAAEQRIYAIRQGRSAQGLAHISSVILNVYERLNELAASDSAVPGLSTGLPDVDMAISGLNKSDPVSYTHLDVYKRQGCTCAHRRS